MVVSRVSINQQDLHCFLLWRQNIVRLSLFNLFLFLTPYSSSDHHRRRECNRTHARRTHHRARIGRPSPRPNRAVSRRRGMRGRTTSARISVERDCETAAATCDWDRDDRAATQAAAATCASGVCGVLDESIRATINCEYRNHCEVQLLQHILWVEYLIYFLHCVENKMEITVSQPPAFDAPLLT